MVYRYSVIVEHGIIKQAWACR